MPEDPTPSAAAPLAGNAATPPALAATPEPLAGDGAETPISLEEAKKLRSESVNLRKRLKAYEDAEQAKREADLTEVQKATKLAQDFQQKYEAEHRQAILLQVKLAAKEAGIVINPDIIASYLESKLEYDDNNQPTNLQKALEDLIRDNQNLVQAPSGPTTPAQTAQQRPPAIPPNAPERGRTTYGTQQPQGPFQPTRLTDVFKRP